MYKVNKDSTIGEILSQDVETAPIFMSHGMHCLGCPMSQRESIEQAGAAHGIDVDILITALNAHFEAAAQ